MVEIITAANDPRADDLANFLHAVRTVAPALPICVILFGDESPTVTKLCRDANARIIVPDPRWERLGHDLFGNEEYRPGIKRAQYFRKLSMFDGDYGCRLFLDANCELLSMDAAHLPDHLDICFHSGAAPGRNFPAANSWIEALAPGMGNGFNLGHCLFNQRAGRAVKTFAELAHSGHRRFLGPAPEQSFLNLAIAVGGLRAGLYSSFKADVAPTNSSHFNAVIKGGVCRYTNGPFRGQRILSIKRSGAPAVSHGTMIRGMSNDRAAT